MKPKTIAKKLFSNFTGNVKYQFLFSNLFDLAVAGKHFGQGKDIKTSGEQFALHYVRDQLIGNKNITIFDIGANRGEYAELCQEIFGETSQIWCFEPSSESYSLLKKKTSSNPNCKILNFGFGNIEESRKLFYPAKTSRIASLYQTNAETGITHQDSETVTIKRLDDFVRENEYEISIF